MSRITASIGELAATGVLQFGDGYRTKQSEHGKPGYRIIRVADVMNDVVSLTGPDFVSEYYAPAIGSKVGRPGDILLTTKGTVGRAAVLPNTNEKVVYSPQLCYFRVLNEEVLVPRFLRFWFGSPEFWRQAADRMNNTDMAAYINLADIRSLKLTLPQPSEQRAIVEVLGALDDKIAANTKLGATAMALGEALYKNAISGVEVVNIPLRGVAKNVAGKYLAKDDYVSDGPYFVYGSNSIMGRHDQALSQGGFAVLAKIGSYCGNLRWSQRPAWVNNNASAIVPMSGTAPAILRHALNLVEMAPHRAGTGQPYIRMESLFSSEVILPRPSVAAALAPVLENLAELEARYSEENTTLEATRDALIPQLMSGQLRVKDAESVMESAGV